VTTDEENEQLYRQASAGVREVIDRTITRLVEARLGRSRKPELLRARVRREVLADQRASGWLRPRSSANPVHPALSREEE
jgi:hypothetical protein